MIEQLKDKIAARKGQPGWAENVKQMEARLKELQNAG